MGSRGLPKIHTQWTEASKSTTREATRALQQKAGTTEEPQIVCEAEQLHAEQGLPEDNYSRLPWLSGRLGSALLQCCCCQSQLSRKDLSDQVFLLVFLDHSLFTL